MHKDKSFAYKKCLLEPIIFQHRNYLCCLRLINYRQRKRQLASITFGRGYMRAARYKQNPYEMIMGRMWEMRKKIINDIKNGCELKEEEENIILLFRKRMNHSKIIIVYQGCESSPSLTHSLLNTHTHWTTDYNGSRGMTISWSTYMLAPVSMMRNSSIRHILNTELQPNNEFVALIPCPCPPPFKRPVSLSLINHLLFLIIFPFPLY